MTIATLADYASANKQWPFWTNHASGSAGVAAGNYFQEINAAASDYPTGGSTDPGSTTVGVVPTSATAGCPSIMAFTGQGVLSAIDGFIDSDGVGYLFDLVFWCGKYVAGSGTSTLGSQPSFSARLPDGTYNGLQLFAFCNNSSGTPTSVTVTYTNEAGTTGQSTTFSTSGAGLNNTLANRGPLAAGDKGIQKIESVTPNAGSGAGAITIAIMRPIKMVVAPIPYVNSQGNKNRRYPLEETCALPIYSDSFLVVLGRGGSNSNQFLQYEVASN